MYTVHMAGLIYFHGCAVDEKLALLPNGTREEGAIPKHFASLWIESDQLVADDWWPDQKLVRHGEARNDAGAKEIVSMLEFRIPEPAEILFPQGTDAAVFVNLESALPKLQQVDPGFEVDLAGGDAIAKVPIRSGRLEAFDFNGVAVVKWTHESYSGPIKITARAGGVDRSVTVKEVQTPLGTEIVFANTSDHLAPGEADLNLPAGPPPVGGGPPTDANPEGASTHDHFQLYEKLNKSPASTRTALRTPPRPTGLATLVFNHTYLRVLISTFELGDPGCTPTCCG